MKPSGLLAGLLVGSSACLVTQVDAAESACAFVSAAEIQTAFGKAVAVTTATPEICDYEKGIVLRGVGPTGHFIDSKKINNKLYIAT